LSILRLAKWKNGCSKDLHPLAPHADWWRQLFDTSTKKFQPWPSLTERSVTPTIEICPRELETFRASKINHSLVLDQHSPSRCGLPTMAITIIAPAPSPLPYRGEDTSDQSDGGVDLEGDLDMRPTKRAKYQDIVTPGELITDDPQWMRYKLALQCISCCAISLKIS
jgi:hypothetical protein